MQREYLILDDAEGDKEYVRMLAYENEMFLTAMQEDGLTIAAKGLGLEQVFLSLVRVHSDPGNLVLVLGCSDAEEAWIIRKMEDHVCKHSVSLMQR